jgi:hypothetical protein
LYIWLHIQQTKYMDLKNIIVFFSHFWWLKPFLKNSFLNVWFLISLFGEILLVKKRLPLDNMHGFLHLFFIDVLMYSWWYHHKKYETFQTFKWGPQKAPKPTQSWFLLIFPKIEIVPIVVQVTLCFQWDSFDGKRERGSWRVRRCIHLVTQGQKSQKKCE